VTQVFGTHRSAKSPTVTLVPARLPGGLRRVQRLRPRSCGRAGHVREAACDCWRRACAGRRKLHGGRRSR